ncbi:hypothetical protein BH10PSE13_BH10PSE13_09690 [soil metagenome]
MSGSVHSAVRFEPVENFARANFSTSLDANGAGSNIR